MRSDVLTFTLDGYVVRYDFYVGYDAGPHCDLADELTRNHDFMLDAIYLPIIVPPGPRHAEALRAWYGDRVAIWFVPMPRRPVPDGCKV